MKITDITGVFSYDESKGMRAAVKMTKLRQTVI